MLGFIRDSAVITVIMVALNIHSALVPVLAGLGGAYFYGMFINR